MAQGVCRFAPPFATQMFEETYMKLLIGMTLTLALLALAGIEDQFAMGPDPGGHTGATVTPETTKTGSSAVDSARQSASGNKTETNDPPSNPSQSSGKKK